MGFNACRAQGNKVEESGEVPSSDAYLPYRRLLHGLVGTQRLGRDAQSTVPCVVESRDRDNDA